MPDTIRSSLKRLDQPRIWWIAAAITLLLGYADLVRGGVTIAPLLLVIGYLVLIPVAILRS